MNVLLNIKTVGKIEPNVMGLKNSPVEPNRTKCEGSKNSPVEPNRTKCEGQSA